MKNKLLTTVFAALLCAGVFAGCASAAPAESAAPSTESAAVSPAGAEPAESATVAITHDLGTVTVPANPAKVVSFDLGIVDALNAVGVEVGGLPQATMPTYLNKFADSSYFNAGSMKEADFEAINEYAPDVIIISDRMKDSYPEFAAIAPTIYLPMPSAPYMSTTKENIEQLIKLYPEKAADFTATLNEINTAAADLEAKVKESGSNALIIMANDGEISAYGLGSRFGIIHDEFGFLPADSTIDGSTHGQTVTFEYVKEMDPDYLFVIDRSAATGGESGAKALLDNELVNSTKAATEGHIVYLSSDVWYLASGGIEATQAMIDEVAASVQ